MKFPKSKPIRDKAALAAVDRTYCHLCGKADGTVQAHHLIHRSFRVLDVPENLIPLCHACHRRTHSDRAVRRALVMGLDVASLSRLKELAPDWLGWEDKDCL